MVGRPVLRPHEVALIRATQNSQNEENIINKDGKNCSISSGFQFLQRRADPHKEIVCELSEARL